MSDGGKVAVQADDQVVGAGEVRALKKRRRDLERRLGKKTMEVEILQEAIEIVREKNCSRALYYPGRTVPAEACCLER
jgi:transposase